MTRNVAEARERLAENLASFDAEAAFELANEGERADLWTEIDVNVEDLRTLLAEAVFGAIDIPRAAESISGMVADWYGNAPLPNARISADIIARRLARFALSPKPGETIGEALAWVFELANYIASDGTYTGWGKPQLSFTRPSVTEGSIRNLRPLYLSAPPKGNAEGVKALEWRENPLGNWVAQSIVGQYFVFKDADDSTWAAAIPDVVARGGFKTADDAKTFAQTHFNSAIRSALTPSPISGEVAEALRELIDGVQEWCDAVGRDTSWDGWDHHYKHYAYNGGLEKARAALAAQPTTQPEGDGR